jgi:uncharacterized protein
MVMRVTQGEEKQEMWRFWSALVCSLIVGHPAAAMDQSFFTLAGGDVGGNYFATARAICAEVNRAMKGAMRCSPEATAGSVYNLAGLGSGQIDFAIVQSDWLLAAREGKGVFGARGAMADLRGVLPLYQEQITILAGKDTAIQSPAGLTGARVDLGSPASGRRATAENILKQINIEPAMFSQLSELSISASIDELCAGRVDAIILVTGHPDFSVRRALGECGARLVPFVNAEYAAQIEAAGLYTRADIPAGTYGAGTAAIPTFAVTATIVTRLSMEERPDTRVLAMVSAVRAAQASLRRRLPVLVKFNPDIAWSAKLGVDVHPDIPAAR